MKKEVQAARSRRNTLDLGREGEEHRPRRSTAKARRAPRSFVLNTQNTIQKLLDQEDTKKDFTITVEDTGPKKYLLHRDDGTKAWIEGTYSISTLLQELALLDINLRTVAVPEEVINEDPVSRLERLVKKCFWKNLRRSLDKAGLKVALIDTKIKKVEFYLYVPGEDRHALEYYKEVERELAEEQFRMKVVPISFGSQLPGGLKAEDTIRCRGLLCDLSPGLLSLSLTRFVKAPAREPININTESSGGESKDISGSNEGAEEERVNPRMQREYSVQMESGPCPFYVPGGRFNEMYGWDSYFIAKGLIHSGELAEAMCVAENLRYQIDSYGKVLNANRSYYLFRGNPPFFSTLVREVLEQLSGEEKREHSQWIESCVDAMVKEWRYFMRGHNEELGLTKHVPGGKGISTETEPGHFYSIIRRTVPGASEWTEEEVEKYIEEYNGGEHLVEELEEFLRHDRAVRESGHDTSVRVSGVAGDLYTVDLNSLLYKSERDILSLREVSEVRRVMEKRRDAINTLLWKDSFYHDYHEKKGLTSYVGASGMYPLFAKCVPEERVPLLLGGMDRLVSKGGLLSGSKESCVGSERQWDYPYGWAPHQMIVWQGLANYGYEEEASELALRWCTMVGKVFAMYNGVIVEKYDLERRSHKVFVEYGNVGAGIKYVPREGFGWTNASFLVGLSILGKRRRRLSAAVELSDSFLSSEKTGRTKGKREEPSSGRAHGNGEGHSLVHPEDCRKQGENECKERLI
jgi:alpha,alpha-trehalase